MSKGENMVERCAAVVKAKLFEAQHRTDTMGFDEIARAVIEEIMEMDGDMWVAGRTAFVAEAEKYQAADRYEWASAIADRAPEAIFQAALRTALSQPNDEGEGK